MSDYPRARVIEIDGQLVLDDPDAVAVATAVARHNCKNTLLLNRERVLHFARRISEKGLQATDVVIVLINIDDRYGALGDALVPDHDWQMYRDQGQVPFARGLAGRAGIQDFLDDFDKASADKLRASDDVAIMVADYGTTEIFGMSDL